MKHALHATPGFTATSHERHDNTDQSRWSLLRLLVAAMLTFAALAAATGLAG
jgi:hypothetical protein